MKVIGKDDNNDELIVDSVEGDKNIKEYQLNADSVGVFRIKQKAKNQAYNSPFFEYVSYSVIDKKPEIKYKFLEGMQIESPKRSGFVFRLREFFRRLF